MASIYKRTTHPSTATMASRESEERSGPATNQQYGDAYPHSERGTSKAKDKKRSKFPSGREMESWRGRKYGRAHQRRENKEREGGQMGSQKHIEVGRAERAGDRENGAGKDNQRASKKQEVGRAEWAYVSSHFSSIALALIDEAVRKLTEERATMSKLQND